MITTRDITPSLATLCAVWEGIEGKIVLFVDGGYAYGYAEAEGIAAQTDGFLLNPQIDKAVWEIRRPLVAPRKYTMFEVASIEHKRTAKIRNARGIVGVESFNLSPLPDNLPPPNPSFPAMRVRERASDIKISDEKRQALLDRVLARIGNTGWIERSYTIPYSYIVRPYDYAVSIFIKG